MPNKRFLAYADRLFAYAVSLARDHDQARDLLQECAVKAFGAAQVPVEDAAYRAWLFRILHNAFVDRQRKDGVMAAATHVGDGEDASDRDVEDHLIDALTVRQALALLSHAHREVIALVDIAGLTYAEVASVLEIPVGTVMSRLSRARSALLEQVRGSNLRPFRAAGRGRLR